MLKALIFDFDGLMIDTEYTWYPIFKNYFKEFHDYDMAMVDFLLCIGGDDRKFLEIVHAEIGDDFNKDHFDEVKLPAFLKASKTLPMMPGVEELIRSAKEAGLKVAMATSSRHPHALDHLKRWGMDHYFDVMVTGDMVASLKPKPDLFNKALDLLALNPEEVFVFEDSLNGLNAANSAGLQTIIIPNEVTKHSQFGSEYKQLESLEAIDIETLRGYKNDNKENR